MQDGGSPESDSAESEKSQEDSYKKYDFYSPRKFTKEKLKILQSVFENYARILTSQVNGIFRTMTDITVMELRESRYYEFVNSFHENACMTVIETEISGKGKSNVPLMMYVSPGLILTLMSHMLGGGDQVLTAPDDYRYSDVEMSLYRRIVEYLVKAMKDGFSNYINAVFRPTHVEENPSMVQEVGLDETVVLVLLNVDVTGISSEKIRICLPGTLLEQMFRIMDNRKHLDRGFTYSNHSDVIMEHIRDTRYLMTAKLGSICLNLEELENLRPGDIIDMNKSKDGLLTVYVGDQPWFRGTMGVHKKNIAIRIEERIEQNIVKDSGDDGLSVFSDTQKPDGSADASGKKSQ